MEVECAFLEMLSEVGGSLDELAKLDIGYKCLHEEGNREPIIHMWIAQVDADAGQWVEFKSEDDKKPTKHELSFQVMFRTHFVDLRDPDSFIKLKAFLDMARSQGCDKSQLEVLDKLSLWRKDD